MDLFSRDIAFEIYSIRTPNTKAIFIFFTDYEFTNFKIYHDYTENLYSKSIAVHALLDLSVWEPQSVKFIFACLIIIKQIYWPCLWFLLVCFMVLIGLLYVEWKCSFFITLGFEGVLWTRTLYQKNSCNFKLCLFWLSLWLYLACVLMGVDFFYYR